ncbi:MAG: death-on-curing protein [Omnitrophica WOR_2 bacterium RIFCSPHIGHO2_01_FULL_48_9]|nr:MAG: death-on-curing protein [Omnitrophica WOR_2 bacterium RIFCSPHIGHO2_02_FULL_48_11]OGX31728.1 MAG: death-on-curing protein [Omnitrophica WOR_2 bacterium RIFCSPHIGHO2_01_FULL_48_9]
MKRDPEFLTLAEVIGIHANQIELYGGQHGIRDLGLLQSALAQPQASFAGEWLHTGIFHMAAAYAFHICSNHPFLDGNKRAALAAALVFLVMNGQDIKDPKQRLLDAMLDMAKGKLNKEKFAQILRELAGTNL